MYPVETSSYDVAVEEELLRFFEENKNEVFYSKQVEIHFEKEYYHWVTSRGLRNLKGVELKSMSQKLDFGGSATFYWHKSNRYYKRNVNKVANLINDFSDSDFLAGLGQTGELLVNEGFTKYGFKVLGRSTNEFEGKKWESTNHNLDFIYERDSIRYGVEVKNTLGYMDKVEFDIKIRICEYLGIIPLYIVRMMPSSWMYELSEHGGVWLIMGYQMYPISHKTFADKVNKELGLPVDAPRALKDGTMQRFMKQHDRKLREFRKKSQKR